MTYEMDAYEREALHTMTVKEIRRAQSIVRSEMALAHNQGKLRELELCRSWHDIYALELRERLYHDNNLRNSTSGEWL